LSFVELELPVVHDLAHGWIGKRRHLHEVEILLLGDKECLWQRLDPELTTILVDQSDLASSDPVVDPGLVGGWGVGNGRSVLSFVPCSARCGGEEASNALALY
jgi:hypothetical protein